MVKMRSESHRKRDLHAYEAISDRALVARCESDYPEQCLVACCLENRCPHCLVDPSLRGSLLESLERDPPSILKLLDAHHHGVEPSEFDQHGIRPVYQPFWHDLPHCVFKDHLVKWCTDLVGSAEIDARFKAMSSHPGLRHFKKGISFVSQWTGTEHKEMEKVFLGILAGAPGTNSRILTVARALLDFIYYAQLQTHTTKTLNALQSCLKTFHENKDVFVELGTRDHFNFPKLHSLLHYLASILSLGANDGYNSEAPERLHINLAKDAYRASNKRDYHEQMALWLQRREAMWQQDAYLVWLNKISFTDDDPEVNELDDSELDDSSPTIASATTPTTTTTPTGTTASAAPAAIAATTITPAMTITTTITATITTIPTTTIAEVPAMETASPPTHHQLAKVPSFRRVSIDTLHTDFGAINFLPALTSFLQQHYPTCPIVPSAFDRFDLYKIITITLPPNPYLSQQTRTNRIRAIPSTHRMAVTQDLQQILIRYW
ncbi:hypothetical protein BD779DRAFT_1784086 [Infundibulicybe gibba]|nr:hypothetical protein BD779DRAFT_1784086 [Infundibulicybe gibba]